MPVEAVAAWVRVIMVVLRRRGERYVACAVYLPAGTGGYPVGAGSINERPWRPWRGQANDVGCCWHDLPSEGRGKDAAPLP